MQTYMVHCAGCGELVHSRQLGDGIVQAEYFAAVQAFNGDPAARTCRCGAVHPPVELGDIAWPEVAQAIAREGEG